MRSPGHRRGSLFAQLVLCATPVACGSNHGSGAAGPGALPNPVAVQGTSTQVLLGKWAPLTVTASAGSVEPTTVAVGGRAVRRRIGLPTTGRPGVSTDGAWVVWSGERGVTLRNVQDGTTRVVPLPAGMRPMDAAFFGEDGGELAVSMVESSPDGATRRLIVVYDTAGLRVTHAVSTAEPSSLCSLVLGTPRDLLCIVDRVSETEPSYVLAIAATSHEMRTIRLATKTGISDAVASDDGAKLYHSASRTESTPAAIVEVDLASGAERSFPAPDGGENYVTGLAIAPAGTHLAIGTFGGAVSLHELPSGRIVRSAEPYGGERQALAVTDDLSLWDYRDHLTMHPASGPTRKVPSPCGYFDAIRITARDVVTASYDGVCVFDRSTLALDLTRSMSVEGARAFWRGDEIHLLSWSSNTSDVSVPRVVRWNTVTGAFSGVDQTYAAMMTALGTPAALPSTFTGELGPKTPLLSEVSGDRAIATAPGEVRATVYDLATGRAVAEVEASAVFLSRGTKILEAAHHGHDAARNAGLVLRSSRDGAVLRTLRPLTDYARIVLAPDERAAILVYERHAELVSLADGSVTPLHQGAVHDAAFRADGAELALAVYCDDGEGCDTRILRFDLPAATLASMLESRERALLAYAPTNDAIALVSPSGILVQPLAVGWRQGSRTGASR